MNEILTALFEHHTWANLRLIDACAGLTEEQLDAGAPGTFGSVRETLVHVVASEEGYLARLERTPPPERDAYTFRGLDDLRTRAERSGRALVELAARTDGDPTVRGDWRGEPYALPTSVFVIQAINHATEHRAQIATVLSQQGVTPPVLDGWTYAKATGRG